MTGMRKTELAQINAFANRVRLLAVQAVHRAKSGHPGGSLSAADIFAVLYLKVLRANPAQPHDPKRDRFVLSKGHCTPGLYAALALRGYFPVEDLHLFRSIEGHMSGHAEMNHVKGVDMSTGSLGQGLSAAVGMAIAGKLDSEDYRVYCMMGDGEQAEGQIWEAAMAAAKYQLDNLCGIVDVNGLQIDGKTAEVMPNEPLDAKWRAFGWEVFSIDGHDAKAVAEAFEKASSLKDKPTVLLVRTVKGKGVSYMENDYSWHGKAPNDEQLAIAEAELQEAITLWEGRANG
jgi:transketolase